MPTTSVQIAWLAGLLDGEGYFGMSEHTPRIYLGMRDEDIIVKARDLMAPRAKIGIVKGKKDNHSTVYCFNVTGILAVQWMMTLYSLMGRRRKEKIREVIFESKDSVRKVGKKHKDYTRRILIESMAATRSISYEEAEKIFNQSLKVN